MNDFLNSYSCDGINVAFTPDEVEKDWHLKLIKTIMEMNKEYGGEGHFDIILTSDDYCTIVRASRAGVGNERNAMFIDDDDVILTQHGRGEDSYYTFRGEEGGEKYKLAPIVEDIEYDTE